MFEIIIYFEVVVSEEAFVGRRNPSPSGRLVAKFAEKGWKMIILKMTPCNFPVNIFLFSHLFLRGDHPEAVVSEQREELVLAQLV